MTAVDQSQSDDGQVLLSAEGVAKSYAGVPALRDGRLTLRRGSVHALCGGNGAGKSTFLYVVMGLIRRDGGRVTLRGEEVDFASPREALHAGVAIITQELSPIPGTTVAENIFLGREPTRFGLVDYGALFAQADALLKRLRFSVDPRARIAELSLAQIQLVEIAKAISKDSEILIMDEPTSAIGEAETEILFDAIRSLKDHGVGIIYVSHRLSELFRIADDYTVFRDGAFVETGRMADIDRTRLVQLIVGRAIVEQAPAAVETGPVMIEVEGFSQAPSFQDIKVEVREGEVLGIFGLMGAGRSEFLNALYGLTRADSGRVAIAGQSVTISSPRRAIDLGIALITEDRKETGLILCRPIRENIALSSLDKNSFIGFVRLARERGFVAAMAKKFSLRMASAENAVETLSGGNQQKVVLSRCLVTDPRILLCDEPTRGIDEGAKQAIYAFLRDFVKEGKAAIVVSSELDEVLQIADRILVFRRGRIAGELARADASHEALLHLAA
jgi:ribose transport system ATP-binding protein/putative xylitol transport system ATP-binding protein